jgi:hypothetical protein
MKAYVAFRNHGQYVYSLMNFNLIIMAEQKTKSTGHSVQGFIESIADEGVRDDCMELISIMKKITRQEPVLWGGSIIGFGKYHYKYDSGHEGDSCLTGFAPRKQNISLYVMPGFTAHTNLLAKLGKHKAGKGCLYIKRLSDIDRGVLETLIKESVSYLKEKYK